LIRLLLDQGLPRSTGKHFSLVDWDVVHVGEIGMCTSSDKEILEAGRHDNMGMRSHWTQIPMPC
jgi:predicted nuclease of predicted toxin-antitoxin system